MSNERQLIMAAIEATEEALSAAQRRDLPDSPGQKSWRSCWHQLSDARERLLTAQSDFISASVSEGLNVEITQIAKAPTNSLTPYYSIAYQSSTHDFSVVYHEPGPDEESRIHVPLVIVSTWDDAVIAVRRNAAAQGRFDGIYLLDLDH